MSKPFFTSGIKSGGDNCHESVQRLFALPGKWSRYESGLHSAKSRMHAATSRKTPKGVENNI